MLNSQVRLLITMTDSTAPEGKPYKGRDLSVFYTMGSVMLARQQACSKCDKWLDTNIQLLKEFRVQ